VRRRVYLRNLLAPVLGRHRAVSAWRHQHALRLVVAVMATLSLLLGGMVTASPAAHASGELCYQPTGVAKTVCDTRDNLAAAVAGRG
jgi:hypothetical protein